MFITLPGNWYKDKDILIVDEVSILLHSLRKITVIYFKCIAKILHEVATLNVTSAFLKDIFLLYNLDTSNKKYDLFIIDLSFV